MKEPIFEATVADVEAGKLAYKICRCSDCKLVAQCTPSEDFFVSMRDGRLRCERCFDKHCSAAHGTEPEIVDRSRS